MNLIAFKPKKQLKVHLILFKKNTGTPFQKTPTKALETLDCSLTISRESCSFDIPLQKDYGGWRLGLTNLESYNSIVNTINKNFETQIQKPNKKEQFLYRI